MQQREFGRTGLKTTAMGLGLAALGRPGYITLGHQDDLQEEYQVEQMEHHAHQVLDTAWAAGVRYFDAARSYGRAEHFLASWLKTRSIDPAQLVVGSKWGYTYTANWRVDADHHEVKEHSLPVLTRQTEESRDYLGRFLNIYHIHSATIDSGVLTNEAVLDELARLRSSLGWVIGLSLSGPKQGETLEKALNIKRDGEPLFQSVQATWNLLETSVEPWLEAAANAGWGVIVKEVVANGRLTPKVEKTHPEIDRAARDLGVTTDVVAIAAALGRPWAAVILSGAAQKSQLESNLKATAWMNHPRIDDLIGQVNETADVYWQTRAALPWN